MKDRNWKEDSNVLMSQQKLKNAQRKTKFWIFSCTKYIYYLQVTRANKFVLVILSENWQVKDTKRILKLTKDENEPTMPCQKLTETQTTEYRTQHRKLISEQHLVHKPP